MTYLNKHGGNYAQRPWTIALRYYWNDDGLTVTSGSTPNVIMEYERVSAADGNVNSCPENPASDKYRCMAKRVIYKLQQSESTETDPLKITVTLSSVESDLVGIDIKAHPVLMTVFGP